MNDHSPPQAPETPNPSGSFTSIKTPQSFHSPNTAGKRRSPKQTRSWVQRFTDDREISVMRFERAQNHIHHSVWNPADGEGPEPGKKLTSWNPPNWKTVYTLWDPIKENHWPPKNVLLSDCWVYLAVKLLSAEERATRYQGDFDLHGDIRAARVPCGNPPVVNAHGIYCLPVFKEFYVLCGRDLAAYGNWILGRRKRKERTVPFTLGLVCVPREAIPADGPNIERHLFFHDKPNQWDMERPATADWKAAEAHGGTYDRSFLGNSDERTMLYSVYPAAQPNYQILPVSELNGFTVPCNSQYEPSDQLPPRPATGEETFTDFFGTGNIMRGPSSQQVLSEKNSMIDFHLDQIVHFLKSEPQSPSMPASHGASQPFDIVKEEQLQEEDPELKKEEGVPYASIPDVMNLAQAAPTVDGIRHIVGRYSRYLQENTDLTLEDIVMHIRNLYAYVKRCRDMQDMEETEMNGE
ncbi:uncharacterized protein KD926_005677 [Aspergillus affinis]|uniref:uncharacterized protein n=1 Tax=Aspergillus affinis TaxID=1070780 RepID=UPI0022FE9D3F|nr:uncharacterized protein KD926_005677 [Aspergillus affinis]KAI9042381.1 hypothetical protein KD926_005677 [Aspergillus affinis]